LGIRTCTLGPSLGYALEFNFTAGIVIAIVQEERLVGAKGGDGRRRPCAEFK